MRFAILAAPFLLAACGDAQDFAVDVNVPADRAYADLSRLSGKAITAPLGLPAVERQTPRDRWLVYDIHSLDGNASGRLVLAVEPRGESASRVHVTLDLPEARTLDNGEVRMLDETRAETELHKLLAVWADHRGKALDASEDIVRLDMVIGALALAVTPSRFERAKSMAGLEDPLFGLADTGGWSAESGMQIVANNGEALSDELDDLEAQTQEDETREAQERDEDPTGSQDSPSEDAVGGEESDTGGWGL